MMDKIGMAALSNLPQAMNDRAQRRALKSWQELADELEASLVKVRKESQQNLQTAVINGAIVEGQDAQIVALTEALKAAAPNHPLLQATAHKFKKDNSPKTKLRLIFEAAFDARWAKKTLQYAFLNKDPTSHRRD